MTITIPTAPNLPPQAKVVLGLVFVYDRQLMEQVKSIPDRNYSSTLSFGYLPHTDFHLQSVQDLGKLELFFHPHLATSSGTIAVTPAQDEPTGISSAPEELSVRASSQGQTVAADIQEPGNNNLHLFLRPKTSPCGYSTYLNQVTFRPENRLRIRIRSRPKVPWILQAGTPFYEKSARMIQKLCRYSEVKQV